MAPWFLAADTSCHCIFSLLQSLKLLTANKQFLRIFQLYVQERILWSHVTSHHTNMGLWVRLYGGGNSKTNFAMYRSSSLMTSKSRKCVLTSKRAPPVCVVLLFPVYWPGRPALTTSRHGVSKHQIAGNEHRLMLTITSPAKVVALIYRKTKHWRRNTKRDVLGRHYGNSKTS